jgi:uncharacterized GH25 family protein
VYGVGGDDIDVTRRVNNIEGVAAYDANFNPINAALRPSGPMVMVDADSQPSLATVVLQAGIFSRMEGGEWERKTRQEWPEADHSERTIKYGVVILGPLSGQIPTLPGQTLQIIPIGEIPQTLGARVRYQVLFNGEPAVGARVIADMVGDPDARPAVTDRNGRVWLRVRNQGPNVVRAMHYGPSSEPHLYTRIEHTATLAFSLPHLPE